MRIKHTIMNISAGLGSQIMITALSFISRTVFISSLGIEYLGINALFTSMLAMLSLAEAGIGSSIIYNLYKPVADQDQLKINVLMRLYRNAYAVIALIVFLLGLIMLPFLDVFIKDSSVENITLIYFLFLINTATPYLFMYKQSFLNVNQKNYVITSIYMVSSIISTCLKIAILIYTENYILFLIVESIITITTSIILAMIVDRIYPFLKNKVTNKLDSETRANLMRNIKAIVLQNIGVYFIFGVDSILISSFISIAAVGLYSNYKMLMDICRTFINQIFNNMYHSVGNLVAKENAEKIYSIYKITMLLNFWLYSMFTILLYITVPPFITVWIGSQYVMGHAVLIILILTFYERGMRNSISTVKTTAGIFHEDRYAPLCQAAINLIVSITLVQFIGIVGIFIGTLISSLLVPFWTTPYLVYKKVFNKPVRNYYQQYAYYAAIGIGAYLVANFVCYFIPSDTLLKLSFKGFVCIVVVNGIYIALFRKTNEFKYILGIGKTILGKLSQASRLKRKLFKS